MLHSTPDGLMGYSHCNFSGGQPIRTLNVRNYYRYLITSIPGSSVVVVVVVIPYAVCVGTYLSIHR